jgi:AcrR family transcriptional regulator
MGGLVGDKDRGRQAERRKNDASLLTAARLVFAMHGPSAPVSAIAAEAGVGIGSLYRRYPTKAALLQSLCLESMKQQVGAARAALDSEPNPVDAVFQFIRACVEFRAGVFTSIAGSVEPTAEMIATAKIALDLVQEMTTRAQASGELRTDVTSVDLHGLIEMFSRRRRNSESAAFRLLEIALQGLRFAPDLQVLPDSSARMTYSSDWLPSEGC